MEGMRSRTVGALCVDKGVIVNPPLLSVVVPCFNEELSLGILGEYVARIYTECKKRPLFLLRDRPRRRPHDENQPENLPGIPVPVNTAIFQTLY
jgi:hypothetical protein